MDPIQEHEWLLTRRQFFGLSRLGIGAAALTTLVGGAPAHTATAQGVLRHPHFAPRAKRIIYLFQSGGPSQMELFDYKPTLEQHHGTELPDSVRMGQRVTGMTVNQASFPVVASVYSFSQHGRCGMWLSELLPHLGTVADELCVIRSMHTEAINHDPGVCYMQTGHQQPGRPSMGAWLSYGIGSENRDLPGFIVLISLGSSGGVMQPIGQGLWSSGFLPSEHQGVQFMSGADPVLYLSNPPGMERPSRRRILDTIAELNQLQYDAYGDPEINTRIAQYEMAYRMQTSVPALTDFSDEPEYIFDLYGEDARNPGTFAANCLLARRLAEQGVRFIQLYHRGWDQHGNLPGAIRMQARDVDQPSAALIKDLKQRGMLEDTLIIWAGEFGRTSYCQGALTDGNYGRDHHGRCFSLWMAGGGIRPGLVYGATDDYCYNIVENPVHVHDLNATILYLMGINHEQLTHQFQGRDYRLTDVHGHVVTPILA